MILKKSKFEMNALKASDLAHIFRKGTDTLFFNIYKLKQGLFHFPGGMEPLEEAAEYSICYILYHECVEKRKGISELRDFIPYITSMQAEKLRVAGLSFKDRMCNVYISGIAAAAREEGFKGELSDLLYERLVTENMRKAVTVMEECRESGADDDDEEVRKRVRMAYADFYTELDRYKNQSILLGIARAIVAAMHISAIAGDTVLPLSPEAVITRIDEEIDYNNINTSPNSIGIIRKADMKKFIQVIINTDDDDEIQDIDVTINLDEIKNSYIFQKFYRKYVTGFAKHLGIATDKEMTSDDIAVKISEHVLKTLKSGAEFTVAARCILEVNGAVTCDEYEEYLNDTDIEQVLTDPTTVRELAIGQFKLICCSFNDEEIKTVTARDVLSKLNRPYDKDEDSLLCAMHSVIISEHIRKMIKISVETVTESCKDLGYSQRIARLERHAKNKEAEADKAGQEALEARKTLENRIAEACRDRDSRISELAGKNDRLTAKLQEKDTEIAELKQRLKEQGEKIEHMKRESKNSVKKRWTPDDFKDKRLLFASYDIDRNLNVIKKMFPDAYYLEDEAAPISGIKADAVIIMGSSISHSLCYKLESAFPRDSIMTYKGRNAERFCDELGRWFERKERNGKKEELAG